jgi:chemotaxis protein histidine kinase CheA
VQTNIAGSGRPRTHTGLRLIQTSLSDTTTPATGRRVCDRNELTPTPHDRRTNEAESSIRVGVTKVDQLINQVGELVITQIMLAQTAASLDPVIYENLHRSLLQLFPCGKRWSWRVALPMAI